MAAKNNEIEDFINGGLVSWIKSLLPQPELLSGYTSLLDGFILHKIWQQIDPQPQHIPVILDNLQGTTLSNGRVKNFSLIVRNIKCLYEEELGQTILMLPDCVVLGNFPESSSGLKQIQLLITLLLGAAVQCPKKEHFIDRMKKLNVETQLTIVDIIKNVTDNKTLVLTDDSLQQLSLNDIFNHLKRVLQERDQFQINFISKLTTANIDEITTNQPEINHMAIELADLKSKLRRMRQELEEKSESYMNVKEELNHQINQFEKLKTVSNKWYTEAKLTTTYRDEVDVLRERSERADRLEIEVKRFREKLSDNEFYKARIEELRTDNQLLSENKEMLEEQLERTKQQNSNSENELIKYQKKLNELIIERDSNQIKFQEVVDNCNQLQVTLNGQTKCDLNSNLDEDLDEFNEKSLSEQLGCKEQSRVFKLELENRRLLTQLDSQKEGHVSETSSNELDNKKLILKVEQLQDNLKKQIKQNNNLEELSQQSLLENKKLISELEDDRTTIIELEQKIASLKENKQSIEDLNKMLKINISSMDNNLKNKTKEFDLLAMKLEELKSNFNQLQTSNSILISDDKLLKESLKVKHSLIENLTSSVDVKNNEILKLIKELELQTKNEANAAFQTTLDSIKNPDLINENAALKAQIKSFKTKQLSFKISNSQLIAEKDVFVKQLEITRNQNQSILQDQITLQCLHDQLISDYDSLNKEKDTIKKLLRDTRLEVRDYRDRELNLEKLIEEFKDELEALKKNSMNLTILKDENSKLSDDFKCLFYTHEELKLHLQSTFKINRNEDCKLENTNNFQNQIHKIQQEREMLIEVNKTLTTERKSMMDHISQLSTQYHELLLNSLQDKQHYHNEEKFFTEKLNNLNLQKVKLEEKIMDHYKKLDSPKRKSFGSSLYKKVYKAGTDIINRVPTRRNSMESTGDLMKSKDLAGSRKTVYVPELDEDCTDNL